MRKGAQDDVAYKCFLLARSAAKDFFRKHCKNVSFLHHVKMGINFLYCELSRLTLILTPVSRSWNNYQYQCNNSTEPAQMRDKFWLEVIALRRHQKQGNITVTFEGLRFSSKIKLAWRYRVIPVGLLLEFYRTLLDYTSIRFGTKLYRQIIGIPMGTNCDPLVVELFFFVMREISWRLSHVKIRLTLLGLSIQLQDTLMIYKILTIFTLTKWWTTHTLQNSN